MQLAVQPLNYSDCIKHRERKDMELKRIAVEDFNANVFAILNQHWMLLTSGDWQGKYNTMTISWGFLGYFWFKPLVIAGVRPQRYTYEFMEDHNTFSLCAFPEEFKPALSICGANSGRHSDKIGQAGLTPVECEKSDAPAFEEAELVIECRKVYADSLAGKFFADKNILGECYKERDFHKLFFGEVVNIRGIEKYCRKS